MGTRGMLGYQVDGQIKGTYNHYDSYPEQLGQTVVDFCKTMRPDFMNKFTNIKWINGDVDPTEHELKKYGQHHDKEVSTGSDWYSLLRNTQNGKCLSLIANNELDVLIDQSDFINDSLYCEWAYVFNFDTQALDIYQGFQRIEGDKFKDKDGSYDYGKCKCVASIKFTSMDKVVKLIDYLKDVGSVERDQGRYKLYDYTDVTEIEHNAKLIGNFERLHNALKRMNQLEDCSIPIYERKISLIDTRSPNEIQDLEIYGDDWEEFYYWQNVYVSNNGRRELEAHKTVIKCDEYEEKYNLFAINHILKEQAKEMEQILEARSEQE